MNYYFFEIYIKELYLILNNNIRNNLIKSKLINPIYFLSFSKNYHSICMNYLILRAIR